METEKMVMELRRIAKNHKNDRLCTGELNLTDMCTDVADRLEELNEFDKSQSAKLLKKLQEYEDLGVTPEQIREIDKLYTEKCREVAELKKKQIPKKPTVVECIHPEWGDCIMGDVDCENLSDCNFGTWCPNCKESLDYNNLTNPSYCPDCGQKLDWRK